MPTYVLPSQRQPHGTSALCRRRAGCGPVLFTVSDAKSKRGSGGPAVLNPTRTFQLGMMSGAAAGFAVDAILFPLDTLKTRLQMAANAPARQALFKGIYNGFAPAVAASAPAAAAFFGTYDYVKRVLAASSKDDSGKWAPLQHMAAAAAGDVSSSTVRVPFEVVKQRLQSGVNKTTAGAVRQIFSTHGVRGFFQGYGSLVLRELPFDAIQFPLYEVLKKRWARRTASGKLELWQSSLCGSAAGGVAAAVTTPLDVVKTRLMTQSPGPGGYKGIVDGLTRIAREEGGSALLSGLAPRVMWISMGGAIFFGSYESARTYLLPKFVGLSDQDAAADKAAAKKR